MGTNGINDVFNSGFKVKLQNRGPKSSGITFELKSVFDEMAKQGLIKDTDGKGFTKNDALNLYNELNKIHQETNRATNYTTMQVGQQFDYTADEMKALAKAAGYEITGQPEHVLTPAPEVDQNPPQQPPAVSDDGAPDVSQQPPAASQDGVTDVPEQPPAADEPPLTSLPDIQADIEMEDLQSLSLEELRQRIKDNNAENRDLNAEIRGIRKEKRAEDAAARKEMRQEARLEAQQARQEKREARMEARMEQKILKETLKNTEATFQSGGQTGKIVDEKYYINNKEVTKEAFEAAQTKALSNEELVESKSPFGKTYSAEEFAELYNMPIQNVPAENEPAIQSQQKSQPIMTDQQLQEYLANDTSYQAHKKTLQDADNLMKELETKYNFERGDFRGRMNMAFSNEEDDTRYFNAKSIYESYTRELPNYEKEMANWVDGPCGENSFYQWNHMHWSNLERITLSNGQKAWKTDQGVFYPGPNGLPGPNIVPEEYLE